MALNAFLTLQGKVQGPIKGSVTQKNLENSIMIIAASHEIFSPTAAAGSGLAVGKRQHKPFVITKELDKSSTALYSAMVRNEELTQCELKFFGSKPVGSIASASGTEIQNYTVRLLNAFIADIKFCLPNTKDPELVKLNPYEEISITYRAIEWVWTDGNLIASDQWQ